MEAASCYSGSTVTSPTATCTKLHTANSLTAPIRLTFWMACTKTIEAIKYFEISLILCSKRVQFCNKKKRYMLFLRDTLTYCFTIFPRLVDSFMLLNAIFNIISVISWSSVLLVEEARENHRPVTSHWQTLSYNVVSPWIHSFSGDRHWLRR
jgi:hypothetical protein